MTHDSGCKRIMQIPDHWLAASVFGGPNDCYRYKLAQIWGHDDPSRIPDEAEERALQEAMETNEGMALTDCWGPLLVAIFMNPSGAGVLRGTDTTVSKFARIAKRLHYRGILIGNVCAYRAKDNSRLKDLADPVGPGNIEALLHMANNAGIVIGHGNLPGKLQRHADHAVTVLREHKHKLCVFGFSDSGVPLHPLARGKKYVSEDVVPQEWAA